VPGEPIGLHSEYTSISARLQAESGSIIDRIEIQFPRYPELTSDQIGELINFGKLTSKLDSECRRNNYVPLLRHPAKQRLEAHQEKWAEELTLFLAQLHTTKCEQAESQIFTLVLSCDGVRPGDNVKVSIEAIGTVLLTVAGEPIFWNRELKIPTPPSLFQQPASPRPTNLVPSYQMVVDLRVRTPDVFYRDTHSPGRCSKLEYSCPEFTHKGAESKVEFRIKPAFDSKTGPNGLLQYTVRARNLPDPVS
jgi:hypothetical protein